MDVPSCQQNVPGHLSSGGDVMTGSGDEVSFGCLLRTARLAAGMTQEDLAVRSGLSVRAISALERDRTRRPYLRSVRLLANALDAPEPVRARLHEAAGRSWQVDAQVPAPASSGDAESDDHGLAPPARSESWAVPRQLPSTASDFTGRARHISRLIAALSVTDGAAGVPCAVISGQPGVGKTSLALYVAHSLRSAFPDGQLWVQSAGASPRPRDPREILGELLRALGVHGSSVPDAVDERAALFRSRIADRRVLLVVDDAASSAQVRPLLPGTAGNGAIVTSRTRLSGLPGALMLELDPFAPDEALDLLKRIIGDERVAAEPQAAAQLIASCGLIPLAVRIAGARLAGRPSWPLSVLAARLAEARRLLDEFETEDLSVRAGLAMGYQALSGTAKRSFQLLSLLGPHDVAEWVVGTLVNESDPSGVVRELVDKSLLTQDGIDMCRQARYRLHDLVREYGAERVVDEPEAEPDAALRRALTGWLQLADMADRKLIPDPYLPPIVRTPIPQVVPADWAERLVRDPIAWFEAERDNLLNVTRLASTRGWCQLTVDLATRQSTWQLRQNRNDDASEMWSGILPALSSAGAATQVIHARLRYAAALIHRGQASSASEALNDCIEQLERMDDHATLAYALYWSSSRTYDMREFLRSFRDAQYGYALAKEANSQQAEFLNLTAIGQSMIRLGQHKDGIAACERALAISEKLGEPSYELAAMHTLAYAAVLTGQCERAESLSLRRLNLSRQLGAVRDEGVSLGVLGDAYLGLYRYEDAARVLAQALNIFRADSHSRLHALCLLKLGDANRAMRRYKQAQALLKQSLAMFRELRFPRDEELARDAMRRCLVESSAVRRIPDPAD